MRGCTEKPQAEKWQRPGTAPDYQSLPVRRNQKEVLETNSRDNWCRQGSVPGDAPATCCWQMALCRFWRSAGFEGWPSPCPNNPAASSADLQARYGDASRTMPQTDCHPDRPSCPWKQRQQKTCRPRRRWLESASACCPSAQQSPCAARHQQIGRPTSLRWHSRLAACAMWPE